MRQHTKCMRLGIINLTPAYVAVQLKFSSQSGYRPNHGLLIFRRIKCNPICRAYTKAYWSKHNAETQKRNKRTLCWLEHKYVAKQWGVTPAVEQNWHKRLKSQIVAVYKVSVVVKKIKLRKWDTFIKYQIYILEIRSEPFLIKSREKYFWRAVFKKILH